MTRWIALVAIAGCWTEPKAPVSTGLPGLVWITPLHPWRMTHTPTALVVDGDTAIVGGAQGWLARVDLKTGVLVTERRLSRELTFYDIARMSSGTWAIVGSEDGVTRAFVLDRDLATTPITLGVQADKSYVHAGVAVTSTGGVVIAGKGLPLAIYDPKTWKITTVLASELGWNRPRIMGNTLGITLGPTAYSFDLATGARTELGSAAIVQATAARVALKVYDGGAWYAEVWEHGRKLGRLERPVSAIALDPTGGRLVVTSDTELVVYETSNLVAPVVSVDLGDSAKSGIIGLTVDGDRAIVSSNAALRVVDLRLRTASAVGAPPWGSPDQLAVDDEGTVLDLEPQQAWWIANGKVFHTGSIDGRFASVHHGDTTRIAKRNENEVAIYDKKTTRMQWRLGAEVLAAWIGSKDRLVAETLFTPSEPSKLWRLEKNGALEEIVGYTSDGDIRDLDPDSDAIVGSGGFLYIVHLKDGTRARFVLHAPGCAEYANAEIERGGVRVGVFEGKDLAVWDRANGRLGGAMRFGEPVAQVVFVPGRDEAVVGLLNSLAIVDLTAHTARSIDLPDYSTFDISPNGVHLAVGFGNGRVALLDVDALRKLAPAPLATFAMPKSCKGIDPFRIPNPVDGPDVWDFDGP